MGVDDLLLGLTHHWSQDTSVFPTEDDRLDLPTIMLFQAYTACRPAELVDGTKSRGGKDPLLDEPDDEHADAHMLDVDLSSDSERSKHASQAKSRHQTTECDPKDESNTESDFDEALFDDNDATSDTHSTIDSDDGDESDDDPLGNISADQSIVTEDGEPARKHKALCYEDIILWIVKDPKKGGRDVLTMEVHFRHHKGADNKPKPYVLPSLMSIHRVGFSYLPSVQYHLFVSRESSSDSMSYKPHSGTRHPRRRNSSRWVQSRQTFLLHRY